MGRPHVHAFWTQPTDMGRVATLDKLRFSATGRRCFLREDGSARRPGERVQVRRLAGGDGLGFRYNGCMGVFDPRPGRAGSPAPGKRRFTATSGS